MDEKNIPLDHLRKFTLYSLCFLIFTIVSCETPDEPQEDVALPAEAVLIGEGVISTLLPEFAASFSPDGETLYFNRTSKNRDTLQIMFSMLEDGAWTSPSPLWFSDGSYFDVDPFVSHDGSRLYFSSNRPLQGESAKDFDTWYVERADGEWGEPINAGYPLNGEESEVFVSLTKDNTIYFSISRDGIRAVYRSEFTDEGYVEPTKINMPIPDSIGIGNPLIDKQDRFMLFTSRQLGSYGGADIYVADHVGNGIFDNVRNAGLIVNSSYSDFAPGLSADGKFLVFTSERPGVMGPVAEGVRPPGDLYKVPLEAIFSND